MSTNAFIGKVVGDEVKYIYVHWDGYLSGVGAELLKNFTNETAIDELIDGGDCSTVVGEVRSYKQQGGHVSQYRTRKTSLKDFTENECGQVPFTYLWNDGIWGCYYRENGWAMLTEEICK